MDNQLELKYVNGVSLTKIRDAIWKLMNEEIEKNGYSDLTLSLEGYFHDLTEIICVNNIKE